jgi:Trypsin-like peptidase domain
MTRRRDIGSWCWLLALVAGAHACNRVDRRGPQDRPAGSVSQASSSIVFDDNDRLEYGAASAVQRAWADATPALFYFGAVNCANGDCALQSTSLTGADALRFTGNPPNPGYQIFSDYVPICAGEPLRGQPSGPWCSSFLVAPDLVMTASHCLADWFCPFTRFVFGYRADAGGQNPVTTVPATDVYSCARVAARNETQDWAIIKLDRPVPPSRQPLPIRTTGTVALGRPTTSIGYTLGTPVKVAPNGTVLMNNDPVRFQTDNDIAGGNSGGPVIDSETGLVEGILSGGVGTDFLQVSDGQGGVCGATNVAVPCQPPGCIFGLDSAVRVSLVVPTFHCGNDVKDSNETDLDCGGTRCTRCHAGQSCLANTDCGDSNNLCLGGTCADHCLDNVKDDDETDRDCGGSCSENCALGKACLVNSDCVNDLCAGGICQAVCNDGVKNGDETDVDCGGSCGPCALGRRCATSAQCQSGRCDHTVCLPPVHCFNGVQDSAESDIDCGADCGILCSEGQSCWGYGPNDCKSQVCAVGSCMALCHDDFVNGAETDLNCGGATRVSGIYTDRCPTCGVGKGCLADVDCASGVCGDGKCLAATCRNQVWDGDETDVDCGGTCLPCALGQGCFMESHCAPQTCFLGQCYSLCGDGAQNGTESDVDCGGASRVTSEYTQACAACANDRKCVADADCASGVCTQGTCRPATCRDGQPSSGETDVDCGGPCGPCAEGQICVASQDCGQNSCFLGQCWSLCADENQNGLETDIGCGGGWKTQGPYNEACGGCPAGMKCSVNQDCASQTCTAGICASPPS